MSQELHGPPEPVYCPSCSKLFRGLVDEEEDLEAHLKECNREMHDKIQSLRRGELRGQLSFGSKPYDARRRRMEDKEGARYGLYENAIASMKRKRSAEWMKSIFSCDRNVIQEMLGSQRTDDTMLSIKQLKEEIAHIARETEESRASFAKEKEGRREEVRNFDIAMGKLEACTDQAQFEDTKVWIEKTFGLSFEKTDGPVGRCRLVSQHI